MSKDKKNKVVANIPEGMKCFQKIGGGNLRFVNRIIKPGQNFWINPDAIPTGFLDLVKEVAADNKAVIISASTPIFFKKVKELPENVAEKFEMVPAVDEDGVQLKKGNSPLYNIIGEDGEPINEKPLRKGKATESLEALNA